MTENATADQFFETYARALLDRDAAAIGAQYGVPALIEFPDQRIAVTDSSQTEGFFNGAFGQYEGVAEAHARVDVVAETAHSIWADVTWTYDGGAPRREKHVSARPRRRRLEDRRPHPAPGVRTRRSVRVRRRS